MANYHISQLTIVYTILAQLFSLVTPSFAQDYFATWSSPQIAEKFSAFLADQPVEVPSRHQVPDAWRGTKVKAITGLHHPVVITFEGQEEGAFFVEVGVNDQGTAGVKVSRVKAIHSAAPYQNNINTPKIFPVRTGNWGSLEVLVKGRNYYPQGTQLLICPMVRKVIQENENTIIGLYPATSRVAALDAKFFANGYGKFRSIFADQSKLSIELFVPENIPQPREKKDVVVGKDPEMAFEYVPISAPSTIVVTEQSVATGIGVTVRRMISATKGNVSSSFTRVNLSAVDLSDEQALQLNIKHIRQAVHCYFYEQRLESDEIYTE